MLSNHSHLLKFFTKNLYYFLFLTIFVILIPVANLVNFNHNDDWVYELNVKQFLDGKFTIHPYIAANFYSTGLLGAIFSYFFGIENLPMLTLLVSVLSSLFIFKILKENIQVPPLFSFLTSLLLLFNPLFVFTTWGFMTDNYFNFFLILSFYFLSKPDLLFLEKNKVPTSSILFLLLGIFFIVMAYFTRQVGLIVYLAFGIWFISFKKFKIFIILFLFLLINTAYHFLFFPKTSEAFETMLVIENLTHFQYIFSLFFAIFCYLCFFSIPVIVSLIYFSLSTMSVKRVLFTISISIILVIFSSLYFKNIGWIGEKMYFLNYSLNTKGFFPENISGRRNESFLIPEVMIFLQNFSLISGFLFIVLLFYRSKKLLLDVFLNPYLLFIVFYFSLLLVSVKIYDRYLIPLITIFLLFISYSFKELIKSYFRTLKANILLLIGVLIFSYYSYNLSADYILLNQYVWGKSNEINKSGIEPHRIYSTDAWRYLYGRRDTLYKFTYTNYTNTEKNSEYSIVEKYEIDYPFKFFDNTVFLYKNNFLLYR